MGDLIDFLKQRSISEDVINKFVNEKVTVSMLCTYNFCILFDIHSGANSEFS